MVIDPDALINTQEICQYLTQYTIYMINRKYFSISESNSPRFEKTSL
jgi:hypothetical protein